MGKAFFKTQKTGGGNTALDGIDGSLLSADDFAVVFEDGVEILYLLVNGTSAATESLPDVVVPKTNAGNKRWEMQRPTLLSTVFDIIAPPDLFAVVGVETNIFFDNLIKESAGKDLVNWDISGGAGDHVDKKWTDTPANDTDNGLSLTLTEYSMSGAAVQTHAWTYRVAPLARHGIVNLMWIGDSTSPESMMGYIATHAAGDDNLTLSLIGTQGTTYKNEAHPGKTASWIYSSVDSPFVKAGVFDFSAYLADNSLATPDLIVLQLGINDIFSKTTDAGVESLAAANFAVFENMFTQFLAENSAVKILLNFVSLASSQTNMGGDYGDGQTAWRYKRNAQLYNQAMLDYSWPHYVTLLAPMHNIDFENEMTNGVHPNATGYQSMADVAYAAIKNLLPTGISYHDSSYNDATRPTTTANFSVNDSTLTTTVVDANFGGAAATFKVSNKATYRIACEVAMGTQTVTLSVGIKLWNGSTAVSYNLPAGGQGAFTNFSGNLNYAETTNSIGFTGINAIDTIIDLSSAPDFDHMSLHFSGYNSALTAGTYAVADLTSLVVEASSEEPANIDYHDSSYNESTRLATTDRFTIAGDVLTTTFVDQNFGGAAATFEASDKTTYRIACDVAMGTQTVKLYAGVKLWNGSSAVTYDIPSGGHGAFTKFSGNLNYIDTEDSGGFSGANAIDTVIDLSSAPDFDHISLHFSGYNVALPAGTYAVVDLTSLVVEAEPVDGSYHDSGYNEISRLLTTDRFTISGDELTVTFVNAYFGGAAATFEASTKTTYRIGCDVAMGDQTVKLYAGIKLWNGSSAVTYELPVGGKGVFTKFAGNLNYADTVDSGGFSGANAIDTVIDLSSAPDFDRISIHFNGYNSAMPAGTYAVVDLTSLSVEIEV